jgi:hypothetical protein
MEHIRQAVELAKARGGSKTERKPAADSRLTQGDTKFDGADGGEPSVPTLNLDRAHLESARIIAHDVMDYRSKPYDMLRTQIVREMAEKNWRTIAITSPTPGCGKTLTAINLALSIARQPNNSVFLADLDLQRPRLATSLALKCNTGLIDVLEGHSALSDAVVQARIGHYRMLVLPCEKSTSHSSEWMASHQINEIIQDIKTGYDSQIVILDLPPILTSDDTIAFLPQVDCALLVTAVGISTLSDVEECKRHLHSTEVVRVVLNKTLEKPVKYYY